MQYLMFTYFNREIAEDFESSTAEERQADVQSHLDWFATHGARVRAGHELAWPRQTAAIRSGHKPVIVDGPYLETKEILGGVIIIEANSLDHATSIASEWPSLAKPGALVEVVPPHER